MVNAKKVHHVRVLLFIILTVVHPGFDKVHGKLQELISPTKPQSWFGVRYLSRGYGANLRKMKV